MSEQPTTAEAARFQRVEAVFNDARKISDAAERTAFVAKTCGEDVALRGEVESWLAGHDEVEATAAGDPITHSLLAEAAWNAAREEPAKTPRQIGRYRILGVIGTGGMGTVFEAEQDDPKRVVALKLLHPELDDDALRLRFRTEAEVLARLHHDGIAHVYDVGEVDTQLGPRLYIAMERVHGTPLRRYLEATQPDRETKLRLLLAIANAVRHAHRNGVIHRDLKPSNILVREDGSPKLLDFGVARQIDDDRDLTKTGHVVGTLRYMSPEQAKSGPVDSRADVYALGVIGYEMLAGRHPRDAATAATGQAGDHVPSLGTADRSLRGDLSIIFTKALEQDPARRYADMDTFAEDLRRFLDAEPIQARPRSAAYQVRMFVARHKIPVAAAGLAVVALVSGLVLALGAAAREQRERERADVKAGEARQAAYVATIKAASADLEAADPRAARRLLADLPEATRGWEWHYLWQQLDGSAYVASWDYSGKPRPESSAKPHHPLHAVVHAKFDTNRRLRDLRVAYPEPDPDMVPVRARIEGPGGIELMSPRSRAAGRALVKGMRSPSPVLSAAPSPVGSAIAAACRDQVIRLFDPATGEVRAKLQGHRREAHTASYSSDGARLATSSLDGVVLVWDPRRQARVRTLLGQSRPSGDLAFLPDRSGLLSVAPGAVRFWDFASESALGVVRRDTHPRGPFIYDVTVSPDGHRVASTSFSGHLELACLATGTRLLRRSFAVRWRPSRKFYQVRFSPDARWLAVSEGRLTLFDARTGALVWSTKSSHREFVFDMSRGRILVMGASSIEALDLATGARTELLDLKTKGVATGLDLSPDGNLLAYTLHDRVFVHSLRTGEPRWSKQAHESWISQIVWNPDGSTLATTSADGTIRLWNGTTGDLQHVLEGHETIVYAAAFSPDGSRLASGAREGTIRIWDVGSGVNTLAIRGHSSYVHALAFDPSGHTLVSGSGDGTVRTWSIRPFAERWEARTTRLRARKRVQPVVEALLEELETAQAVLERIETDFPEDDRAAARDVVLLLAPAADSK